MDVIVLVPDIVFSVPHFPLGKHNLNFRKSVIKLRSTGTH